jgi:hypothetical protein
MGKAGCLGILLILFGVFAMIALLALPLLPPEDYPELTGVLASLVCRPDEELVRQTFEQRDLRGYVFRAELNCLEEGGELRSVDDNFFVIILATFGVPFAAGMVLAMVASARAQQKVVTSALQGVPGVTFGTSESGVAGSNFSEAEIGEDGTIKVGDMEIRFAGGKPTLVNVETDTQTWTMPSGSNPISGGFTSGATSTGSVGGDTGDLTRRLKDLQTAYDKQLINREEYERLRQQILDNMK